MCHIDRCVIRSSDLYDLGLANSSKYIEAIDILEHYVAIWPNPQELQRAGSKMDCVRDFERIAKEMGVPRLNTVLIDTPSDAPRDYVIKREFSDCSSHVFLPGMTSPIVPGCNGHRWFAQEYAPLLQQWGEFRTFIVGGEIIDTVFTKRRECDWTWCIMYEWYSLAELQ